jgi:four helix bundle protein
MLRIYPVVLELAKELRPSLQAIQRRDADLGRQFRRALTSVPLNLSEGSYSRGGNRSARYHTAAGSLREVLSCLEVGAALGYCAEPDAELRRRFDHVLGTLVRLVGR